MESPKRKRISALNYIQAIYDFGFISLMIPYRVVWSEENGYILHSNIVQRILSGFIQFIIIYESSVYLVLTMRRNLLSEPIHYLILGHNVICLVFRVICIRVFWFRRRIFVKLLRKVEDLNFLVESSAVLMKIKCVGYGIMLWVLCSAIAELISINVSSTTQTYMGGKFENVINEAHILYLHREISNTSRIGTLYPEEPRNETSILEAIAAGIHLMVILPHYICMDGLERNILVLVLFCRHLVIEFIKFAKRNECSMDTVLRQYLALKEVIFAVNETFGILILVQIMACLPFYPTWTGIVIFKHKQTWFELFQFASFFGSFLIVLGVAAEVNSKMGDFYKRASSLSLSKGLSSGISSEKLTALSMDMYSEQVAITGGGYFNLTYRFLGTVLSIMITYTVVIIQFQTPKL